VQSMTTLNKAAAEVIAGGPATHVITAPPGQSLERRSINEPAALSSYPAPPAWSVHSMTDITGFGLIGHAREMALASNVSLTIYAGQIPLLEGALECVRAGFIPGGLKANRDFAECMVGFESEIPDEMKALLFDPQTAGGLLIAVTAEQALGLRKTLEMAGVPASEIGEVTAPTKPLISVVA